MKYYSLRLMYAEKYDGEEPFSWYRGQALSADQLPERAQVYREMGDIARGARLDRRTPWGRMLTARDRQLIVVEVMLPPEPGRHRRGLVTIAISAGRPDSSWARDAAVEAAEILGVAGFDITQRAIEQAFKEGWEKRPPFGWILVGPIMLALASMGWRLFGWIRGGVEMAGKSKETPKRNI